MLAESPPARESPPAVAPPVRLHFYVSTVTPTSTTLVETVHEVTMTDGTLYFFSSISANADHRYTYDMVWLAEEGAAAPPGPRSPRRVVVARGGTLQNTQLAGAPAW